MNEPTEFANEDELDLFWRQPLGTVGLAVRTVNTLRNAGIGTVGQLVQYNEGQLNRIPGLGLKAIRKIHSALAVYGLRPGQSRAEWHAASVRLASLSSASAAASDQPLGDSQELAKLWSRSIDYLDLPPRAVNCLGAKSIASVGQLAQLSHIELLRVPNLGAKTLRDIVKALERAGLTLGMERGECHGLAKEPPSPIVAEAFDSSNADEPAVALRSPELSALAYLHGFRPRELAILQNRVFASRLTLEELGQQFDITRERIRQIEKRLLGRLERYRSSVESKYLHALAQTVRSELGAAVPVDRLDIRALGRHWSAITSDEDREFVTTFAMWGAGPYTEVGGWLSSAPDLVERITAELNDRLDSRGWLSAEATAEILDAAGVHREHHTAWMLHIGYRTMDQGWFPPRSSIPDKTEQILRYRNAPMTFSELCVLVGSDSERSIRDRLLTDGRFKKVSRQGHLALREWTSYDEYSGIAAEIAEELERQGGSATVVHLMDTLSERYGVKRNSVYLYTSAPMFVKDSEGLVRLRRPDEPLEIQADPFACQGLYRSDACWKLRVDVTSEALRGSGRPLQQAVAVLVGCQPGERVSFPSPVDEIVISWPAGSAAGPNLGSLKPDIEALGGVEGDFVFLTLGQPRIDLRLLKRTLLDGLAPQAELALMVGLPITAALDDSPWAAIAAAIGINAHLDSIDVETIHARLMQRNEVALARLIGDQVTDDSENILDQLEGMLGL